MAQAIPGLKYSTDVRDVGLRRTGEGGLDVGENFLLSWKVGAGCNEHPGNAGQHANTNRQD